MYSFFFGALPGWLSVFTCNLHFYDYCQSMRFCVCACVYNNFMFLVYLWLRDYYYYNFDSIMFTFCMWVYPSTKFTTISFFCLFFFFFMQAPSLQSFHVFGLSGWGIMSTLCMSDLSVEELAKCSPICILLHLLIMIKILQTWWPVCSFNSLCLCPV